MTLLPGDVIATGTPSGIGPLAAGDSVTIKVAGVGRAHESGKGVRMKLFIDTGNLQDIEKLVPLGIIDGITTNPSLLAKESGDYKEILKKICQIVQGPTSAEVTETEAEAMIRQGRDLAKLDPQIVVKVPLTRDGIKACKTLSGEGIKVNVTLCFSPAQALLAAKVGATYISPFVGRLDDIATPGMELIREIVEIYDELQLQDRGARRQHAQPHAHRRSGADGRRHLHVPAGGHRLSVQPPADRHRPEEVPRRLGQGVRRGGQGLGGPSKDTWIRSRISTSWNAGRNWAAAPAG